MRYIVGIDEAGRGALAGPVSVGAIIVPPDFDWGLIPGVKDSKQLTPKKREEIFKVAEVLSSRGRLHFAVSFSRPSVIDRHGINYAVARALSRALSRLSCDPVHTYIKLDGLLSAPDSYVSQATIIRGDETEKEISLASICAKVVRDRYMVRLSRHFPAYAFHSNKGYGTQAHRDAIKKIGIETVHRSTYCAACISA